MKPSTFSNMHLARTKAGVFNLVRLYSSQSSANTPFNPAGVEMST